MKISIADTYEAMSKLAADDLAELVRTSKNPLISPASGDSPAGLYKEIVRRVSEHELDTSYWNFVALDEWVGMNGDDEGSCKYHLDQQLFSPLAVSENQVCFFDGRAANLNLECSRAENFIHEHGGIDVAIIGIGLNGHVGMNEPGTPVTLRSHVAQLDQLTATTGQKYFKEKTQLSKGITLGITNLMEAKHVFLLAGGKGKAAIIKRMFEEEISEQLPATLLRNHDGFRVYLDSEAAALIEPGKYE